MAHDWWQDVDSPTQGAPDPTLWLSAHGGEGIQEMRLQHDT